MVALRVPNWARSDSSALPAEVPALSGHSKEGEDGPGGMKIGKIGCLKGRH